MSEEQLVEDRFPEEDALSEDATDPTPQMLEEFDWIADELHEDLKEIEEQALFDMRQHVNLAVAGPEDEVDDDIDVSASSAASQNGGYRVVDLRGRFCPPWSSWGNSGKGYGVVAHYNGPPAPLRAWKYPLAWMKFISDYHARPGHFAPGWRINGIAYCEWILGRTVYRLRNYGADLPHCGNLAWNRNAIGLHLPIGGDQRPIQAAWGSMLTMRQRAGDHLRAMGHDTNRWFVGHQEVGASRCPGPHIMAGVRYFRSG